MQPCAPRARARTGARRALLLFVGAGDRRDADRGLRRAPCGASASTGAPSPQAREGAHRLRDRPAHHAVVGPGYLPCPDLDNDGWAEATCGSQNGDSGQAERLGRLPWKTLGLPDLRDGYGERLWYAVSSKYKGLLNCAVSRACLDMTPEAALGTISVRDTAGALLHDGTLGDARRAGGGALAVVIAPGPPLTRAAGEAARAAARMPRRRMRRERALPHRSAAARRALQSGQLSRQGARRALRQRGQRRLRRSQRRAGTRPQPQRVHPRAGGPCRRAPRRERPPCRDRLSRRDAADHGARGARSRALPALLRVAAGQRRARSLARARVRNAEPYFGTVPDTPFTAHGAGEPRADARAMVARDAALARAARRAAGAARSLPHRPGAAGRGPDAPLPAGSPDDEASTPGAADPSWWNAWKPSCPLRAGPGFAPTPWPSCDARRPAWSGRSRGTPARRRQAVRHRGAPGGARLRVRHDGAMRRAARASCPPRPSPTASMSPSPALSARARFTLIEVMVVLVILAVLMSGLALPLAAQVQLRRYEDTRRQLDEAKDALLGFVAAHGACRARPPRRAAESSFAAGGSAANGNCAGFPFGLPSGGHARPLATGPRGFVRDAWNTPRNRIRYAVFGAGAAVNGVANPLTRANGMQAATLPGLGAASHYLLICASGAAANAGGCGPAANQPAHAQGRLRAAVAGPERPRRPRRRQR